MDADNKGLNDSLVETAKAAAESIIRNSFAVWKVSDSETSKAITAASHAATLYFQQIESATGEIQRDRVIDKRGNLLGYNQPSAAKYLFRAFVDHPSQPWPTSGLKSASRQVAPMLHQLLLNCFDELVTADRLVDENPSPTKKRSVSYRNRGIKSTDCPLDYFFYHNAKPEAVNCSEHVDRGILICVCLTTTPGLEVRLKGSRRYACPEARFQAAIKEQTYKLVCVMAGDRLGQYCPNLDVPACVHRVRDCLQGPRLSISYELRPPVGDEHEPVYFITTSN